MVTGWFWMALAGSGWYWVAMARSGLLWLHPWISNAENKQGGGRLRIIITSSFNVDIKNKVTKLLMYIYPYSMFVGKMCIRENVKVSQPKIYMVFILSKGFLIPYRKLTWDRKLAQVGFEPMTLCLPCTHSNQWAIWLNDKMFLMVYRIKLPQSSSHC